LNLFFKKLLLLALLLILAATGLNFLGIRAGKVYKDGAALVCETKRQMVRSGDIAHHTGKINLLFLGTSRILAGINPVLFDRLAGGKTFSYNLALPALPISSSYFVLSEYIERNPPPRYVAIQLYINRCRNCTLYNYYAAQGLRRLQEIFSLFMNMKNKSIIFNYFFPFRMYKYFTVSYLHNILHRPEAIRKTQRQNRSILERMKKENGYYFIKEQAVAEDNRLPEDFKEKNTRPAQKASEFDPYDDPFVKKFFDLALEKGIKVLLIQPAYRPNQYLQFEHLPLHYDIILQHYPNVNVAPDAWKLKFYPNSSFSDQTHLNPEGANRYTTEIFNEFKKAFPDFEKMRGE
jgi:hypothetical protein